MITLDQYVGPWSGSPDWTPERRENASTLLQRVNLLEEEMVGKGILFALNPHTHSNVSGQEYGGFRPQNCAIGAPHSAHKEGRAVDLYDPTGAIDSWILLDFEACNLSGHPDKAALVRYGLYIEHPEATPGWSHWSTQAPGSGKRIFRP